MDHTLYVTLGKVQIIILKETRGLLYIILFPKSFSYYFPIWSHYMTVSYRLNFFSWAELTCMMVCEHSHAPQMILEHCKSCPSLILYNKNNFNHNYYYYSNK